MTDDDEGALAITALTVCGALGMALLLMLVSWGLMAW